MLNNFDFSSVQTGGIMVSAYQELLEGDSSSNKLWGYCLRIENNSPEKIRLLNQNVCITDEFGNSRYTPCLGFNGELPDLEPGECYEYEGTAHTESMEAVMYGFCRAVTLKGKELKIKLPVLNLSSSENVSNLCFCN